MPSVSTFCVLCKKDVSPAYYFKHLNSKHSEDLWTEDNVAQMKKALTRSPHSHVIYLTVAKESFVFSPFSSRFYQSDRLYHASRKSVKDAVTIWKNMIQKWVTEDPTPLTSTQKVHECPCCTCEPTPQPDADAHTD